MANILLAWQNRIDTATLSGGSWNASLPLNNVKSIVYQKVARTSNLALANTQFAIDFGKARPVGVLALLAHSISESGRFRVNGNDTASFTSPAYNSGWIDCFPSGTLPPDVLNWEDDNFWFGRLSQDDLANLQSPIVHVLSSEQNLRYWRVEIDDGFNADGYIDIGRVVFARAWRPGLNYSYGADTSYFDNSPSVTTLSGTEYFDERPRGRAFQFTLDALTDTETYNYALEMQRIAGVVNEVLIIPDSEETGLIPLRAFAGRLTALNGIKVTQPTRHSASFEIKEIM